MNLDQILLIAALVCFILATLNVSILGLNLVALGLAFWVLTLIVGGALSSTVLLILIIVLIIVVIVVLTQRGTFNRSVAPRA